MRTILRYEGPDGVGPYRGAVGEDFFITHLACMGYAAHVIPGFTSGVHRCAIEPTPRALARWFHEGARSDATNAGLTLCIYTVRRCLEENPDHSHFDEWTGREPREYQVAFDPADVIDCIRISPLEFRHDLITPA